MVPVKQKRWDPVRDEEIVSLDDTIKGYEIAKGRYVTIEDDELARFAAKQEKTIEILEFVAVDEIDPVYYERTYWVEPQDRADRPYALLLRAMERSGRAAIGRFVLSTKEHLVLLRAMDGALVIETLYYPEDLRIGEQREIAERIEGVDVKDEELAIADQLIESLTHPFDAAKYRNETRRALLEFLEAKANGQSPVIPDDIAEPAPVVDLMAALKASLATTGAAPEAEAKQAPRKRGAKKDQLSIDEAKLRKVEGEKADDEVAQPEQEGARRPARRTRAS
jgi:DNA end-binding protein Ku